MRFVKKNPSGIAYARTVASAVVRNIDRKISANEKGRKREWDDRHVRNWYNGKISGLYDARRIVRRTFGLARRRVK